MESSEKELINSLCSKMETDLEQLRWLDPPKPLQERIAWSRAEINLDKIIKEEQEETSRGNEREHPEHEE